MTGGGRQERQKGAALLTTILLMTVIAGLTISIVDDIVSATRRASAIDSASQNEWLRRSAENYAQVWLGEMMTGKQQTLAKAIASNVPAAFNLGEDESAGTITLSARDGQNCFNVNGLAKSPDSGDDAADIDGERAFLMRLLERLATPRQEAEVLVDSIQDWVDGDEVQSSFGAENLRYSSQEPPYRAANSFMTDISELRALPDMTEEFFARVQPFLCAAPSSAGMKINVNTLSIDQAPLLAALFDHEDGLTAAREIVARRPIAGYGSIDDVWNLDAIRDMDLKGSGKNQIDVRTRSVIVSMYITVPGSSRAYRARFSHNETGVRLAARRNQF